MHYIFIISIYKNCWEKNNSDVEICSCHRGSRAFHLSIVTSILVSISGTDIHINSYKFIYFYFAVNKKEYQFPLYWIMIKRFFILFSSSFTWSFVSFFFSVGFDYQPPPHPPCCAVTKFSYWNFLEGVCWIFHSSDSDVLFKISGKFCAHSVGNEFIRTFLGWNFASDFMNCVQSVKNFRILVLHWFYIVVVSSSYS